MSCSKLVPSLDRLELIGQVLNCGENGHAELGWSKNIRERISQFYFQLVRTNKYGQLDEIYTNLIIDILKEDITKEERDEYLSVLYKMIAHTRDIVNGKGEYSLSYMMIACWAKLQYAVKQTQLTSIYEELQNKSESELSNSEMNIKYMFSDDFYVRTNQIAYLALENFLKPNEENSHPIGSFKDVKYFINYWRNLWDDVKPETKFMDSGLINLIIHFVNSQLRDDINQMLSLENDKLTSISLISKWIPREKSNKFGWMTKYFAREYFSDQQWFSTTRTIEQEMRAEKKVLTEYRKLLSKANAYIDTTQIKQCDGKWGDINFDKNVTSITLSKQKQAFMNKKKSGRMRFSDNEDRIECAKHFTEYIQNCKTGTSKIKGKRVSIYDFVKDAMDVVTQQRLKCQNREDEPIKTTIDTINLQWKDNSTINCSFNSLITMVDTSGSMTCDNNTPLYNAIGLGIRIAERSTLGKRILTFDSSPTWVNLNDCPDFVSCVEKIHNAPWGMNTNFYLALEKILHAYIEMDLSPEQVEKYGLVILSDMQIDTCVCDYNSNGNTMFEEIERKFALVGMNSRFQQPYKPPFIVFWNLRKTNGFPSSSMTKNVAMISGYSPYLLNQFLNRGIEAFTEYNSWDIMNSTLEHPRYNIYKSVIGRFMCDWIH